MAVKNFYISQFFRSLSEAMISPFLSVFLLFLGATKPLIGLASTLPNLFNLFFQTFWGSLSEKTYKKKIFIILGGAAWALMWIPIAFTKNPIMLVTLLTIQAILSAASTPAWTSLLLRFVPTYKAGEVEGNFTLVRNFANLIGTLTAGLILNTFGFLPFFFFLISFFGLLSRLPFIWVKEVALIKRNEDFLTLLKNTFNFSLLKKEKKMLKLICMITFLNFSVSFASPFLSVYLIANKNGNLLNVTIISIISALCFMFFSRPWGRVVNKIGPRYVFYACIIPISFLPSIYVLSPTVEGIYLYEVIAALGWAGFNIATFAYLAYILPRDKLDSSIGLYNMIVGLGSSVGPILGGILSESLGLTTILLISTFLRFLTLILIEKLEEEVKPKYKGGFEIRGLIYRVENFVSTYSIVIKETLKEGLKILSLTNHKLISSFQKDSKQLKRISSKKSLKVAR